MDVVEAIKTRRSIRAYQPTPIPDDKLMAILNSVRHAPSAKNAQPWKLIIVRDEELKRKLIRACNNQKFVAEAPIVIAACANMDEAYGMVGGTMNSYPIDVAIAIDHLTLVAVNEGLGTCWIGSFKEDKVKEVLGVPEHVRVVVLVTLGYPAESPAPPGRKPIGELICYDKYE
jgi:nitroreductase